jgi:NRAMP (natural resistance-associated macrophage protein)-like metal ion transporter
MSSNAIASDHDGTADAPGKNCNPVPPDAGFFARLGPGLITGASDDDPSGIATYSQAGAAFGYGLLWTMVLTLPLMSAIQEISARIGRVSGHGLAGNLRRHYPRCVMYPIICLLVLTNTINIGADIGAMGDATRLFIGGPALLYCVLFALLTVLLQIFASYKRCSSIFKLLAMVLFSYIVAAFLSHVAWKEAFKSTFVPRLQMSSDYWATFVAVLGTTISPYLFSGRHLWRPRKSTKRPRKSR